MRAGPDPLPTSSTTVSWHDAREVLPRVVALDGLSYVRQVAAGELPPDPLMEVLGIRVVEADPGRVVMACTPQPGHLNLGGIVHGGLLSVLMDCASGFALHTTFPAGATGPHLQVSYSFLKFALAGQELRCSGEVLRSGRTIGHVRAEVLRPDGEVVATGQTANAIVRAPEGALRPGPSA